MSVYQGYPFQFSEPFQPIGIPEGRFQSTLPIRVSTFADQFREEAKQAQEILAQRLGVNSKIFARSDTITPNGHVLSWAFPECPPSWISTATELIELVIYLDGM